MKPTSKLIALCGSLALAATAHAATVYQIDFERSDVTVPPIVTQAGWTSIAAANAAPTTNKILTTTGLTITAGGTGGYFQGRGSGTWVGPMNSTSWNDMVTDVVSARSGDGTVTFDFTGLDDLTTYAFTAWHNVSATDGPSFAAGLYTITPSITSGTLVGVADTGTASNWDKNDTVTDATFDTTMISFIPSGGNATVKLASPQINGFLVMSGMTLESVPEPSSLLLGLGGLALFLRRRK